LQKISLQFGSDLPFFFEEKSAIISMKGEEIIVYDKSFDLDILIVKPSNNLATREVFENFKNDFSSLISTEKILSKSVIDISKEINNDLTKSAVAIVPQISQILDDFKNFNCLVAKMSGSGSSCFAIFDNLSQMNECEIFFKQKYQNYFIKKTKICN
jgi:4-diphosphocytidyl-2-C-methyl-D-erythritol kinase